MKISTLLAVLFAGISAFAASPVKTAKKTAPPAGVSEFAKATVIGISIRTNRTDESGPNGKILPLWKKFNEGNLLSKIPERADQAVVAVYSNTDKDGNFTYTIGARVKKLVPAPTGFEVVEIPQGFYYPVLSERGDTMGVARALRTKAWGMTDKEFPLPRRGDVDFEFYGPEASDFHKALVKYYVSVKAPETK